MKSLHQKLCDKYGWYCNWHETKLHKYVHWALFIAFAGMLAFGLYWYIIFKIPISVIFQARLSLPPLPSKGNIVGRSSDHILVGFRQVISDSQKAGLYNRYNLTEKSMIQGINVALVSLPSGNIPEKVIEVLNSRENSFIEFAEVDAILAPSFIPNDPYYLGQWHHPKINSPGAWDTSNGSGMTIAIADTGVDGLHEDLASHIVPGWNFFDNNLNTTDVFGHGTKVAATAAAVGDNALGIAGESYASSIMPLRVSGDNGYASYSTIAQALTYAADQGVRVVNVSYQISGSSTIRIATRYLENKGGLAVASAGNYGSLTGNSKNANLIVVSATDQNDNLYSWSNYGNDIDVSAPGLVYTATAGGGYNYAAGTSFSSPIVAGVFALVWSKYPALTPQQVQDAVFSSALDLGETGWDQHYGWGRIDAQKAMVTAESIISSGSKGQKKPR